MIMQLTILVQIPTTQIKCAKIYSWKFAKKSPLIVYNNTNSNSVFFLNLVMINQCHNHP
jgi:hypothetical protein